MRISIFTGRDCDPKRIVAVKKAIVTASREYRANLLVLPGNSLGSGRNQDGILQELADKNKVSILAEVDRATSLFRPSKQPRQFCAQQFAVSPSNKKHKDKRVTPCKVRKLIELLNNGDRIFKLAGKRIAVLLCGENNILHNIRAEADVAHPRYNDIEWPFDVYDVLVNSTHTSMGHWNLLHKRFAYFSRGDRTAVHCTNNTHRVWGTSLCVYQNGSRSVMGNLENYGMLPTHIENNWRMVTIEV
ncbi:MAG: hypothetical protein FVQ84_05685 [Planctomycetes bacterium]|nr:hypothetical protein [Planctomycetota bacterium]